MPVEIIVNNNKYLYSASSIPKLCSRINKKRKWDIWMFRNLKFILTQDAYPYAQTIYADDICRRYIRTIDERGRCIHTRSCRRLEQTIINEETARYVRESEWKRRNKEGEWERERERERGRERGERKGEREEKEREIYERERERARWDSKWKQGWKNKEGENGRIKRERMEE